MECACIFIYVLPLGIFPVLDKKRFLPRKEKPADGKDTSKVKVMLDTVMRNWRAEIR